MVVYVTNVTCCTFFIQHCMVCVSYLVARPEDLNLCVSGQGSEGEEIILRY